MSIQQVYKFQNENVQLETYEEVQKDGIYKHLQILEKEGRTRHLEGNTENLRTLEEKRKDRENT